jgi:hypothetical protein
MRHNCAFFKNVCSIAIPVALQSMFQSRSMLWISLTIRLGCFSVIDIHFRKLEMEDFSCYGIWQLKNLFKP